MYTLAEALSLPDSLVGAESRLLGRYPELLAVAFVVPPTFEEGFYRQNNLPEQLSALFAPVRPQRVDEDLLEPLCVRARALLLGSALLDDSVQALYRALHNAQLGRGAVHLRRPGQQRTQDAQARPPGSEVLYALKRLWADDWRFEAVLDRLDYGESVALEARPVLIVQGAPGSPDPALADRLQVRSAWVNAEGLVGLS